jgi:thiol-disulfide isomerase/thioredoxin
MSKPGSGMIRLVALMASVILVAGACGSDDGGSSGSDQASDVPASELTMVDVADGSETNLEAVLANDGDKPKLAWFWAPHCSTCRGEAPDLDAFVETNGDRVDMVGIGSRDDFELAEDFRADTGVVNFPLYWEETGQSWVDNAVAAQPYMILFFDGEDVERWPGGASIRQLEDALAQYG